MRKHLYSLIWYDDPTPSNDTSNIGSILSILKDQNFDKIYLFRPYEVINESIYKIKEARLKEVIKERYCSLVEIHTLPKEKSNQIGDWKEIYFKSLTMCLNKENNEDILWYVNFSAGTPIMISALTHALITLEHPIISIYVNENYNMNTKKYDVSKKLINTRIENSLNTITIASILPLQAKSILTNLKKLLNNYDYEGAAVVLSSLNNKDLVNMCYGASALISMDFPLAIEYLNYTPLMHIMNNKTPDNIMHLIVYINNLELKIDRKEYFDFVMRTSPLLYELLFIILTEYRHFPKELITKSDAYKTDIIVRKDLYNIPLEYRRYFENFFRNAAPSDALVLNSMHLLNLISYQLTPNISMVSELNDLRDFEWKIRNEFAHVFSLYTKEYIFTKTNKTPEDIVELYKTILRKIAFQHVNEGYLFNLYKYINQNILDLVSIVLED